MTGKTKVSVTLIEEYLQNAHFLKRRMALGFGFPDRRNGPSEQFEFTTASNDFTHPAEIQTEILDLQNHMPIANKYKEIIGVPISPNFY
ncbi:hypothetical protein PR048_001015 [Dryococelus australis]|uniref:Uncharacterized protein n=1 Tax=Dryococelus australis TaxID=614101 RepID=A0ABQ9IGA6_9NEOP|nr:hypothetical protein PR048_001015 [Dryococelus australis]